MSFGSRQRKGTVQGKTYEGFSKKKRRGIHRFFDVFEKILKAKDASNVRWRVAFSACWVFS